MSSIVLISKTSIVTLLLADMSTAELVEKDLRKGGNVDDGGRQGTWSSSVLDAFLVQSSFSNSFICFSI